MPDTYLVECALVGESFANEDGSSRQDEIANCRKGEPVALRWDQYNSHDSSAVAVHSLRGTQIGFLRRDDCREILDAFGEGRLVAASISAIYGGSYEKPMRGVEIDVECGEDDGHLAAEQDESDEATERLWAGRLGFWLLTYPVA